MLIEDASLGLFNTWGNCAEYLTVEDKDEIVNTIARNLDPSQKHSAEFAASLHQFLYEKQSQRLKIRVGRALIECIKNESHQLHEISKHMVAFENFLAHTSRESTRRSFTTYCVEQIQKIREQPKPQAIPTVAMGLYRPKTDLEKTCDLGWVLASLFDDVNSEVMRDCARVFFASENPG